ncbi:MAG: 30S ribosomal protein S4 [Oscillospiraceae bacterium]|nr:30S ribosomal protein S4 [Oscillospiraceae bacterium]
MSRYTGAVCRYCRREGEKLFLKGSRCYSEKCAYQRRSYAPGQHGQGRKKASEYGSQLRMKQKARRFYGVQESQFAKYFDIAVKHQGITGENLLRILESRMDNIVYRAGFANSRKEARQLVTHRHFMINGKRINIPSYLLKEGDILSVRSIDLDKIKGAIEANSARPKPAWMDVSENTATILRLPDRNEIDTNVDEQFIVEFYSR